MSKSSLNTTGRLQGGHEKVGNGGTPTAAISGAWKGGNISTFGGNTVSCAAASATIDTIQQDKLLENCEAMGELLREGLDTLKAKYRKE